MKDGLVKLKNGDTYYILDEDTYKGKNYALAINCNVDTSNEEEVQMVLMEVIRENGEITVNEVADNALAQEVCAFLQSKNRMDENH